MASNSHMSNGLPANSISVLSESSTYDSSSSSQPLGSPLRPIPQQSPPLSTHSSEEKTGDRLRIAFVMHVMQVAGAEMLVAKTIRSLRDRIDFSILCLDNIGTLGEQLQAEGIEVINLQRKPGRDYKLAWRMSRELRIRKIDILHAHQYTPFFYAALAKVLAGGQVRLIFTEHGRHFPDIVSPYRRFVNRTFLDHQADAVTGVCQFTTRALVRKDGFRGARIEVIDNGIEFDKYAATGDRDQLRRQFDFQPEKTYITHVARFHPIKDHETLVRAFAMVAEKRKDVDLVFAGDGEKRSEIEELVRELGIADRVRFLGIVFNVPELLQAADIFALTSISEAASLTLMEAMACGLPIVATDVGGNPEIVRDEKEGLLAPRKDAPKIASQFLRLLENPQWAAGLGAAAKQRANDRYRLEQTVRNYDRLYRALAPARIGGLR